MRYAWVLLVALALTLGGAAYARQGSDPPQEFGAGVELVQVDVSVLDRNRRPVTGLTASDFTLFEDGQPRPIVAFTEVSVPPRASTSRAAWITEVPSDIATNDVTDEGRLVVILMDRTIPFGFPTQAARRIARAAVEQLAPGDLGAVVYTGSSASQGFTSDRARLMAALGTNASAELSAESAAQWEIQRDQLEAALWESDPENASVTETEILTTPPDDPRMPRILPPDTSGDCYCGVCVLDTIASVANAVRDVRGRQKLLLFIGADITIDRAGEPLCEGRVIGAREAMFQAVDRASLTVHAFDANGLETNMAAASSPQSTVDAISPRAGAPAPGSARSRALLQRQGNLGVLPSRTGGRTVLNTNDPAGRVPDAFRESASYYLLGLEPAFRDGREHAIRVEVNRRGVTVRARRAYVLPPRGAVAPDPTREAVTGIIAKNNGVTLTASALTVAAPGTRAAASRSTPTLIVALHAQHEAGSAPSATGPERVDIVTEVLTLSGRSVGTFQHTATVTPRAGASGNATYDVLQRIAAAPGRYELRIGVSNTTRRHSGSVYAFVDVPSLGNAPVTWSDIGISTPGVTPAVPAGFADVLPALPIARREFDRGETVTAFISAYHTSGSLPAPIEIVARITDAQNRRRFERTVSLAAADFNASDAAAYRLDLPLASLEPGAHLLTMEARAAGTRTTRHVRFTVR